MPPKENRESQQSLVFCLHVVVGALYPFRWQAEWHTAGSWDTVRSPESSSVGISSFPFCFFKSSLCISVLSWLNELIKNKVTIDGVCCNIIQGNGQTRASIFQSGELQGGERRKKK